MPAYPNILQAIWLLIVIVLLILVVSGIASVVAVQVGVPPNAPAVIAVVNLVGIGLGLAWGVRKSRAPAAEVLPLGPIPASVPFPLMVTIMGAAILLSEVDNLVRSVLPLPPEIAEFFAQITGAGGDTWGSVLILVVVAPLIWSVLPWRRPACGFWCVPSGESRRRRGRPRVNPFHRPPRSN
ncbi:MAG: hypothetical protein ACT4PY_01670 [Armatimonadota bacterium]